jgi:hypothetical protein
MHCYLQQSPRSLRLLRASQLHCEDPAGCREISPASFTSTEPEPIRPPRQPRERSRLDSYGRTLDACDVLDVTDALSKEETLE